MNKQELIASYGNAYAELEDALRAAGANHYETKEILEWFEAADYNVNESMFIYALYDYDLMRDLYDWFIDNGGDKGLID